jgi:ADP-dependent NAD(P)H-hydrate dehydratase / NAD(P)H-hydrate epimerase
MKAITSDEMRALEEFCVKLGLPARVLMEIAGMKVANIAANEIKRAGSACAICGRGGNGGDGFVAARYLHNAGIKIEVFLVDPESSISSPESLANLNILKKLKIKIIELTSEDSFKQLERSIINSNMVIDAIYGIGWKGGMKDAAARTVDLVNNLKKDIKDKRAYSVLSVDVPSGMDASNGEVSDKCVAADITVTFEYPKLGLLKYPASDLAGKIITVGIGIPKPNPVEPQVKVSTKRPTKQKIEGIQVTDPAYVASVIPRRKVDCNKGDCGKVLVIAGSSGMMGAAVLTASAALRTGSGLVTLCVPDKIKDMVNSMSLETVVAGFADMEEKLRGCDCIAIGPGLSKNKEISRIVNGLIRSKKIKVPLVIDADGLNAISDPSILKASGKHIVLTPHPGEFSRLCGRSIEEIQRDRINSAKRFADKFGVTLVLKGAYTVIAGEGRVFINPTGNPGMASAGVGDVLTGIIASLIGQGVDAFDSAVAGTYIHGAAGNMASSIKGERGLIASDIISSIPYALASIV